jgi:transposase
MTSKRLGIHVVTTNREYKGKIYKSHLLRRSYREDGKVKKETVSNITRLGDQVVEIIRRALAGEQMASVNDIFQIEEDGSPCHGHVAAVLSAMDRLGFAELVASRRSRERDLVVAMVAARLLEPQSKLSTVQWWHTTTLPEALGVGDADEGDLYAAMDWVLQRQCRIEKKLATRHLDSDGLALYDLTSSYFEGVTCPLAALGHPRDGKKGKLQVNYGLLTNQRGIPVSVSVFEGNTGDPKTLLPQVEKVQKDFGIKRFVLVGDRGMITQKQIDSLQAIEGVDWIGALRPEAIKKLVRSGELQMGLFDERNLFELTHPDFPGERLVACRNPDLARRRADKRKSLLDATTGELEKVRRMVGRGRLHGKETIGARVRSVLKKYKIGTHYTFEIRDDGFDYVVDEKKVYAEVAARTSEKPELTAKRLARCKRHIEAIAKQLGKVRQRIEQGRLHGQDEIGLRVGKVVNKYKVGKHFNFEIRDDSFDFQIDEEKVAAEAALDGIYVVRTSLPEKRMNSDDAVRSYKLLSQVERAFRSFKTIDLMVRPIRHRLEDRVRAHIFLCMLSYYVLWYMMEAWRPLLYCDEDQEAKATRDPVAPAKRSEAALRKVHTKRLDDDTHVYRFRSLLSHLGAIVRNTCRRIDSGPGELTFTMDTPANPKQKKAYELLKAIEV